MLGSRLSRSRLSCLRRALFLSPLWVLFSGLLLALSASSPARAYLTDSNDARTVAPGTLEVEFQPVGYWRLLGEDPDPYLITPSLMIYTGLASGMDLVLLSRGYASLGGHGYTVEDSAVLTRVLLRSGSYDADGCGPSLALQAGINLPAYEGEGGWGATRALLLSHSGEHVTVHSNVQVDLRDDWRVPALFLSSTLEGPYAWPIRPVVEVTADLRWRDPASADFSGLLGVAADLSDSWAVMAGGRVGDWTGSPNLELRLAFWASVDVI